MCCGRRDVRVDDRGVLGHGAGRPAAPAAAVAPAPRAQGRVRHPADARQPPVVHAARASGAPPLPHQRPPSVCPRARTWAPTWAALTSCQHSKHLRYGRSPRAFLDVHCPATADAAAPAPVVLFVYGGGWSSGSRWMYTLVAGRLAALGHVVVVIDYTLYPAGYVDHMLDDVADALAWTQREIRCATHTHRERER
jgi:acetyl esterase/lipase